MKFVKTVLLGLLWLPIIAIVLAVSCGKQSTTSTTSYNDDFGELAPEMKRAINLVGYKCDTLDIDSIIKYGGFDKKHGFHVYCNNYYYGYSIEDVGGKVVITVDR